MAFTHPQADTCHSTQSPTYQSEPVACDGEEGGMGERAEPLNNHPSVIVHYCRYDMADSIIMAAGHEVAKCPSCPAPGMQRRGLRAGGSSASHQVLSHVNAAPYYIIPQASHRILSTLPLAPTFPPGGLHAPPSCNYTEAQSPPWRSYHIATLLHCKQFHQHLQHFLSHLQYVISSRVGYN